MKTMKLTGLNKMELMEVPEPKISDPFEVKIKLKIVGVCGSDIHYYKHGNIGSQIVNYPFAVGHECAGEVIEIGSNVSKVAIGDKVAIEPAMPCWNCDQCRENRPHTCRKLRFLGCPGQAEGCLSEYIVMPETSCFPVKTNTGFDEAAISEPLAIGVYAVNRSGREVKNKDMAILGFGPIGLSVFWAAQAKNFRDIYVTDKLDYRVDFARKIGAKKALNPLKENIIMEFASANESGVDVVFECCGQQEAMDQAIDIVKPGGKIMLIGIPEFDHWEFNADKFRRKEIQLINVRRQNHSLEETLNLIESGKINVLPMATHKFSFENTKQAFDLVAAYDDNVMKALIYF